MSQGASGGKGGNAPSGPQFDYAAAKSGAPGGASYGAPDMSNVPDFMRADMMAKVQKAEQGASGFQNAALAQGQSSQQNVNAQTQNNRPDQTNAFGASVNWGVGPDGRPTQTQTLGGDLGTGASELEKQIASGWSSPLDNGAQARDKAEQAIYGRETSRLDPMWKQREQETNASLANAGLAPDSEAGGKALDVLNRGRNDAYSSALQQAIMGGGQEASRQQAMDLTSRMAPEQALGGLQGLTQQPGFMGAGAADPTQYLQAAIAQYGGELQKYGIGQQGKNSTMGGLANLGGTLGGAALLGPAGAAAGGAGASILTGGHGPS